MNQLFEEVDITKEFTEAIQQMQDGDIYMIPKYTLLDAMSATELFDKKIDTKCGLNEADTPQKLLAQGKIKSPDELTNEEILSLFDITLGKLILWFQGHGLPQTIYTLVYFFGPITFQAKNEIVNAIYQSINSIGQCIFNLIKNAPYLRDEDYIPSIFSFQAKSLSLNELLTKVLNPVESIVQQSVKKKKQITTTDGILARIKFLKGVVHLIQTLSNPFSDDLIKNLGGHIDFLRKRLETISQTQHFCVGMENYISPTISKHIPSMISNRQIPSISNKQMIDYVENMMMQLEKILEIAKEKSFFKIVHLIDELVHKNPKNTVIRAYLETNLFKFEQNYPTQFFQIFNFQTIAQEQIIQLFPYLKEYEADEKIKGHIEYMSTICCEYIVKQLRPSFRQMRDFHKIYQHFSLLIHESSKIDEEYFKNQKQPFMIFSYEIALQMMVKQLTLGFELELYSPVDYEFIFYYLEYIMIVQDKNNTNFLNGLPPSALQGLAGQKGKKNKKLTEIQESVYYELPYYKGIQLIGRAYSRLCYILRQFGLIENPNGEDFKYRYSNRLKIFEYCLFIKPVTYSEYENKMKEVLPDQSSLNQALDFVCEALKSAQKSFQSVEEKALPSYLADKLKELVKITVISSVGVMKLKMQQAKIKDLKIYFKPSIFPYIPIFELV